MLIARLDPTPGNGGIVPPWLRDPIPILDNGYTTDDVGRVLNEHGFIEVASNEFHTPTQGETA